MNSEATRAFERVGRIGRARSTPPTDRNLRQQMTNVREAFRMRRLARAQRNLYDFYDEHSMFDEAGRSRRLMMHLLRTARTHWRCTLGLVS